MLDQSSNSIYMINYYLSKPTQFISYNNIETNVKPHIRNIVIEWIIENVTCEGIYYGNQIESVPLILQIFDRIVTTNNNIPLKDIQAIACIAMNLGTSYLDRYAMELNTVTKYAVNLCKSCRDTYTIQELKRHHISCFKLLDYNLSIPTAINYLTEFHYLLSISTLYNRNCYLCAKLTLLMEFDETIVNTISYINRAISIFSFIYPNSKQKLIDKLNCINSKHINSEDINYCDQFIQKYHNKGNFLTHDKSREVYLKSILHIDEYIDNVLTDRNRNNKRYINND